MGDDYDLIQPWAKRFPLCKPPTPGDKADTIYIEYHYHGWACHVPLQSRLPVDV